MTDEHALENARLGLVKARAALTAAKTLAAAGLWDDAVSRAYYAAFHAAQALLVSAGVEAKSHAGVHSLLWEHFVKPGTVGKPVAKDLAALQRYREEADYDSAAHFDEETGAEEVERAERVLDHLAAALKARGVSTS